MDKGMEVVLQDLSAAIGDLKTLIADSKTAKHETSSASISSIHGGGVGVWVACTCCVAMMTAFFIGGLWMTRELNRQTILDQAQDGKISTMSDYLSAIYQRDPSLKPKENKP